MPPGVISSLHTQPHLLHQKYRPDIDGLRAIAVLSVVSFHAFSGKTGFIGVDIFFVISGFLITTIILGSLEGEGFSYRIFYARRIRRIFPALALVMAATLAGGWFLLLPDEWMQLGRHLAGGAGFVSNFVFWSEAGYFDTVSDSKLLLHLWSLGIEEQFYILWPLLLGLAWWRKWPMLPVLAGLILLSFLTNVVLVTGHPDAAFYAPWPRAWELMVGAILACPRRNHQQTLKPWLPWSNAVRAHVQSTLGLGLIVLGLLLINDEKKFPGFWALLPTLGAVFCIAAGPGGWFNRAVLASRALAGIGLISYPLYLWHWPLLAFARVLTNDRLPSGGGIGVVLASFALAWLTYRLVEKRLRHGSGVGAVAVLCAIIAALGLAGVLAASGKWNARRGDEDPYLNAIINARHDWDYPGTMKPITLHGQQAYRMGNGPHKVLLIGDSHLQQIAPRLQALLGRQASQRMTLDFITEGGCPPIAHAIDSRHESDCAAQRDAAFAGAGDHGYDAIVLGAVWNRYFSLSPRYQYVKGDARIGLGSPDGTEAGLREIGAQIGEWVRQGKKVYLLLDTPAGPSFGPEQLIQGKRWGRMTVDRFATTAPWPPEQAYLHERMRETALHNGARILDPIPVLCHDGQCLRMLPDGTPVYKDDHHLTASYVRQYATWVDALVDP